MQRLSLAFFITVFLLLSLAAEEARAQSKRPRPRKAPEQVSPRQSTEQDSAQEAIAREKVKVPLSELEAKASEAEAKEDWKIAAGAYYRAARAARFSGQLQKSISYGNKAIEIGAKIENPLVQARAGYVLGLAYRQLGQKAKSAESLEKGIEISKQINQPLIKQNIQSSLYRELGMGFLREREIPKAIEYISYSLKVQDEQLSFLKSRRGKSPLIAQRIQGTQRALITTLDRLGDAYQQAGKPEEAIKAYEKGIAIIRESGLKIPIEGNLYQGLGQLYLAQKDFPRALDNLQKSLEIAERTKSVHLIQQASSRMGDLLLQTQRAGEAIPFYKKAIDSIESTRSALESEEFRSSFFENKRRIYAGMIRAYLRERNLEEAFNYSERARSRALLDILGSKVQLARGTLLEHERALQARISILRAMSAEGEADVHEEADAHEEGGAREETGAPGRREELRRETEAAQKAYNDFLAEVRKENREQASLMNVEPLTLKQVQELLEPEVTVLEYFVTTQAVLLWVVEKDRVRFVNIPVGRKDLVGKVTFLRDSIYQVAEKEKFKGYSEELYRLLIEPALRHIRGKELLIIPHDVLHYLPFQSLLSSQGRYLIQDSPIYYLSSASLMQFTREKRRASRDKVLVMGNPSLGDEAYNLRFAEREAKEVVRVYPKSEVYLKEQASKPKAISLSSKYDVLHFAVHAEFSEEEPLSSALLLAREGKEDGRLRVEEIFSLDLKADMVVLSACETGLGKLSNGDELVGLTRAFIYAGTPSVVTTLWKVNDRSSYELMREFYSNLKSAKKSEALRQAQLKTMQQFPEPFYWAAYGLTGEP